MSLFYLEQLMKELEQGAQFPPKRETQYRNDVQLYIALRESNARALKPTWWDAEYPDSHTYIIDPLGERIPGVWADMLFGEEPQIEPGIAGDSKQLEDFVNDNYFQTTLPWAEEICSSEGEVWSRLCAQPEAGYVQLDWLSRLNVIPVFIGTKLIAAAVFSVLAREEDGKKEWIYVEYHCDGWQYNRLYYHSKGQALGQPLSLDQRMETQGLRPEWNHSQDMLVDRIINKRGHDWCLGRSDLGPVAGLLLGLNEITNIGQENARLTAKQKVVIPQRFLDAKGRLPRGAEIIIATEVDQDPDKIKNDFAMIEWEFDATAIINYKSDLTDVILTRARVAPQLVGRHTETAQTGPALRARLVDTILAANSKGKIWDDKLPKIVSIAAQLEREPILLGGVGKDWSNPSKLPTIKRKNSLPEDPSDRSNRIVTEKNAGVMATQTAIEELNPQWGEDRVTEELDRIKKDQQQAAKLAQFKGQSALVQGQHGPSQDGQSTQGDGSTVPDPASGTARRPGQRKPSTVPDPTKR